MKLEYDVFDYLNLSAQEKLSFFMDTRSEISHFPNYWFNFKNVEKNMKELGPDLFTLDWLIGKSHEEYISFFKERPQLLSMVPQLLGIRKDKFEKDCGGNTKILKIQRIDGEYYLDFKEIDYFKIDQYIDFVSRSGLEWALREGLCKSVHDYVFGVEAGMDSNGRKNRSGKAGEEFLEKVLFNLATNRNWIAHGQTDKDKIKEWYEINLDDSFANRRYDGSLFDTQRKKLYLFEINNFNASGSKSKASATEFKDLRERFSRTNHEFIYITDGRGWDRDRSHLLEAMEYIGKVFNYNMIEAGYLDDFIK